VGSEPLGLELEGSHEFQPLTTMKGKTTKIFWKLTRN
jgi:hypothetical protein